MLKKRKVTCNLGAQGAFPLDPEPTVMKREKRLAGHRSPGDLYLDLSLLARYL